MVRFPPQYFGFEWRHQVRPLQSQRVLKSIPGARFWAGTFSKRLQLFYSKVASSAGVSETLSLSLLLSPLDRPLVSHSVSNFLCSQCSWCAPGPVSSRASIRHMQFQMREGAQPGSYRGYCQTQKSSMTWGLGTRARRQPMLSHVCSPQPCAGLSAGNSVCQEGPWTILEYNQRIPRLEDPFQTFWVTVLVHRRGACDSKRERDWFSGRYAKLTPSKLPVTKRWLCHWLAVWSWASHFTSLCFRLPIYKIRNIRVLIRSIFSQVWQWPELTKG